MCWTELFLFLKDWINVNKSKSRPKSDEDKYEFLSESNVIIRDSLLLVGVLDKNAYGATTYGLVHCYFEVSKLSYISKGRSHTWVRALGSGSYL